MESLPLCPLLYSKCYHVGFTILLHVIYYNFFLFLFPSAKLQASVCTEHSNTVCIFNPCARLPPICHLFSSLRRTMFSFPVTSDQLFQAPCSVFV